MLSVVIVTYNSGEAILERLAVIQRELEPGDELVIVDNASGDGTADLVAGSGLPVKLIRNSENVGFAAASNAGAAQAGGDLLLFLNPDAEPEPGAISELRAATGWGVWQGLVLMPDGATVNSAGGVLHYLGIGWAGGCGEPAAPGAPPSEVAFASGACLMTTRERWDALGGFGEEFFMYCEDMDLSIRARLLGERVGMVPTARFRHEYEFQKGGEKWRLLERNRWFTVIRTYPRGLLLGVLPALLAAELGITVAAAGGGWLRPKLRSQLQVVGALPRLARERRQIAPPPGSAAEVLRHMTPALGSPYISPIARSAPARALLNAYWRLLRLAVRA